MVMMGVCENFLIQPSYSLNTALHYSPNHQPHQRQGCLGVSTHPVHWPLLQDR